MSSRFIHVVECVRITFLFKVEFHCVEFYLSTDDHLGCFHFLALVNKGAMNMGIQII